MTSIPMGCKTQTDGPQAMSNCVYFCFSLLKKYMTEVVYATMQREFAKKNCFNYDQGDKK